MKQSKGDKKRCDDLLREILKIKHSDCQKCGVTQNLQVSHIVSRRFSATRCDPDNVQLLCAKDHIYYTNWPLEFAKWINESIGPAEYERLKRKAEHNSGVKLDWEEEKHQLQQIKAEVLADRERLFV